MNTGVIYICIRVLNKNVNLLNMYKIRKINRMKSIQVWIRAWSLTLLTNHLPQSYLEDIHDIEFSILMEMIRRQVDYLDERHYDSKRFLKIQSNNLGVTYKFTSYFLIICKLVRYIIIFNTFC